MKNNKVAPRLQNWFTKFVLAISVAFVSVVSFAQDTKKVDVDINADGDGGGSFFASPWVWIIGVAVFILLLVALMRGGARRDV
jgi:hypothetical protein